MNIKEPTMQNVTGAEHSPKYLQKMLEASAQFPPDIPGDDQSVEKERIKETKKADSIGSVPLPKTTKGIVKKSFNKLLGTHPEVFLDKLGERLAFERAGVRLYDLAIAKAMGLNETKEVLDQLKHIREEEAQHMTLLSLAITSLGADPTAMTPSADLTGVLGQGLMQILSDPRTDMLQALHALLNAEAIDNTAWELLIELANTNGQQTLTDDFENALTEEQEHLVTILSLIKNYLVIKT